MSVDFCESAVFMSVLASHSVHAKMLLVERTAILGLEVVSCLQLLSGQLVNNREFFVAVSELTTSSVDAGASFAPVLADVPLVLLVDGYLGFKLFYCHFLG